MMNKNPSVGCLNAVNANIAVLTIKPGFEYELVKGAGFLSLCNQNSVVFYYNKNTRQLKAYAYCFIDGTYQFV